MNKKFTFVLFKLRQLLVESSALIVDVAKNFLSMMALQLNVILHQEIIVVQSGDTVVLDRLILIRIIVHVKDVLITDHQRK